MKNERTEELLDGRRARGADNRRRIVDAFVALVGKGNLSPTAEEIASRADVGLRTVFRHFDDMESLYREISAVIEVRVRAIVDRPLEAKSWRDQLREIIGRRVRVYEEITPYKLSAMSNATGSAFLRQEAMQFARLQRAYFERVLPPAIRADKATIDMLDMSLSFEAWLRLRREQELSAEAVHRLWLDLVDRILKGAAT
ncbi:MAG TPA: TetR/AcrR family transcriptional regulator [Micropepsaceae bacterium]|nr:TetR/AcrR family transcriptional regulator [Micropepsaceae bacterium]